MVTATNPEPGLVEQFPDGCGQEIAVLRRVVGRRGDAQVAGPAEADQAQIVRLEPQIFGTRWPDAGSRRLPRHALCLSPLTVSV